MTESMLPDIVRVRLSCCGERTVMLQHIKDGSAAEELDWPFEYSEAILACLRLGKMTSRHIDGYVIWESEFRAWRALGLEDVLWGCIK